MAQPPAITRLLLLSPGGPLVVDFDLRIAGQTLADARRAAVEAWLTAIGVTRTSPLAWERAIEEPRFFRGAPRGSELKTRFQRERFVRQFDADRDGNVSTDEAATYLGALEGARPGLRLVVSDQAGRGLSPIARLLDGDGDGQLSASERLGALAQLKSRDVDDNDWLDRREAGFAVLTLTENMPQPNNAERSEGVLRATLVDRGTSWSAVAVACDELYGQSGYVDATSWPVVPGLVARIDRNQNGRVEHREIAGLADVPCHLRYRVDFAAQGGEPRVDGTLVSNDGPHEPQPLAVGAQGWRWPGQVLSARIDDASPREIEANLAEQFVKLDRDANNYLDSAELSSAGRLSELSRYDLDGNGQASREEFIGVGTWNAAIDGASVTLSVDLGGDPWWGALDTVADGRLSLREMTHAADALQLSDTEAPTRGHDLVRRIELRLTRGAARPESMVPGVARAERTGNPTDWFSAMDYNGDGDLSRREFLGSEASFARLDRDADGLIDRRESAGADEESQ